MKIPNNNLILEIQSQNNNEFQSIITITPWGIEGSSKLVNYEDGCSIYFGYETILNQVSQIIYISLKDIIDFFLPLEKKVLNTDETDINIESKSLNKNTGLYFKIKYDFFTHKYYLKDMGDGFGTFVKIDNSIIKENTIINIGDSFLIFSFKIHVNYENDKKINNQKILLVKVCNEEGEFRPIILGKEKDLYTIGRSKDADLIINDTMLSRINCFLYYNKGVWKIQDGSQNGEYSTNGTWVYAFEDTEILDYMIFKSNKYNFCCKYSNEFKKKNI